MTAQPVEYEAEMSEDAGPVLLTRMTDEELVVLDAEHPLVRLPHYEALTELEQRYARTTAMRGFRVWLHEVDEVSGTVALPQHVCDLLDFREAANCVLLVQIVIPDRDDPSAGTAWQHYAFVDDDFVLLETVSADGIHDFWALERNELAAALQRSIPTVEDGQDGTGEPWTVDLSAVAAGRDGSSVAMVGRTLVQIDAVVWRAPTTPDPILAAVVVGDRGTFGSASPEGARGLVTLSPVRQDEIGETLLRLLALAP